MGRDLAMVAAGRDALCHFRAAGGEVVITTGRTECSARRYYDELDAGGPAILCNGARTADLVHRGRHAFPAPAGRRPDGLARSSPMFHVKQGSGGHVSRGTLKLRRQAPTALRMSSRKSSTCSGVVSKAVIQRTMPASSSQ
ncbi:HAD hydrolase family protein [Nonomuraea rhodomycinica]|uniref:HAD hydrolase family protein n=1 Tax=Nonomuraea rhodomycinica TaxID=1712872 RepID=A0A7Y6IVG0_9ACTN|nr:HAD hydrolase family protein [Nonomuraea rhodomycinica]